jgi:ferric-dicitrate binding protein FerR (iron transport regulator)
VITELNRYNKRKLQIADPHIANMRIGGGFRPNRVDDFVRGLAYLGIVVRPAAPGSTAHPDDPIQLVAAPVKQ